MKMKQNKQALEKKRLEKLLSEKEEKSVMHLENSK